MKKLAELADGPTLETCRIKGRAGDIDDKTYYSTSDSLLAFRSNISPDKKFCNHSTGGNFPDDKLDGA
jgi:hypothetical protein